MVAQPDPHARSFLSMVQSTKCPATPIHKTRACKPHLSQDSDKSLEGLQLLPSQRRVGCQLHTQEVMQARLKIDRVQPGPRDTGPGEGSHLLRPLQNLPLPFPYPLPQPCLGTCQSPSTSPSPQHLPPEASQPLVAASSSLLAMTSGMKRRRSEGASCYGEVTGIRATGRKSPKSRGP